MVKKLRNQCYRPISQKIEAMKELDHEYKEYMINNINLELKRIENLLKEKVCWEAGPSEVETYRALEKQRDKLLQVEEMV